MQDMSAFERQIATRLQHLAGPEPVVDVSASVRAATTTAPKKRLLAMFSATRFVIAGVIVASFGGFLLATVLTTQQADEPPPAGASPSASPTTSYVGTHVTETGATDWAWNLVTTGEARWWANGDTVSRTDMVTGEETIIPLPSSATRLVSTDDAIWAAGEAALHRIDRSSLAVTDSVDAPGGAFYSHPNCSDQQRIADGSLWALAGGGAGATALVEIDLAKNVILGDYPVGDTSATKYCGPWMDVIGDAIWVRSGVAGQLTRFDLGTRMVTDRIDLPATGGKGDVRGCCVAVDDAIWIYEDDLLRFDLATLQITDTIDLGPALRRGDVPVHGGVAAAGAIWITGGGEVFRIDLSTREVTDVIKVGRFGGRPLFWQGAIWVSHTQPDGVSRIDIETRQVTESVGVRGDPQTAVADGDVLWVPTDDAGWSRIDAVAATG